MKKFYIKPVGTTIIMRLNENIAISAGSPVDSNGGRLNLNYTYSSDDSTKFIAFSSIEASSTGNEAFDTYMNNILAFTHGLYSNCGDHSNVMPI